MSANILTSEFCNTKNKSTLCIRSFSRYLLFDGRLFTNAYFFEVNGRVLAGDSSLSFLPCAFKVGSAFFDTLIFLLVYLSSRVFSFNICGQKTVCRDVFSHYGDSCLFYADDGVLR